jgi:hypothetical protein
MSKTKLHTIYRLKDKTRVPGASTVAKMEEKETLHHWLVNQALEGLDPFKVRDEAGEIGTLAHYMVACHLTGKVPDFSESSPSIIDKASNSFLSYLEWEKAHIIRPIIQEVPIVSEIYKYGGQPDIYGEIDGILTLLDFKTGGIFDESRRQIAAYRNLIIESGLEEPERCVILSINREANDTWQEEIVSHIEDWFDDFLCYLKSYWLHKKIKGGK